MASTINGVVSLSLAILLFTSGVRPRTFRPLYTRVNLCTKSSCISETGLVLCQPQAVLIRLCTLGFCPTRKPLTKWSKHGQTCFVIPGHDPPLDITVFMDVLTNNGALTNNQKLRIERIQKRALRIVFGTSYTTYEQVLSHCTLQSLEERRQLLCSSFMESTFNKTTQFRQYLPAPQNTRTLRRTLKIPECLCKTDRMRNSALPYLVRNFNIS